MSATAQAPAADRPAASTALANLRILDLTRVRAGPTCCRIFADFGADVIKIEAPDGVDPNESMSGARDGYDMLNLHRNKRSLSLNLKRKEGLELFLKLVESADVVVENYRPDVKARLGIDYPALKARNPRIILASISGFGQDGPYARRAGFDQIAQGMGGLMWVTGLPGQGPVRAGAAVADSTAGLYAATGILVALRERDVSGEGQWVQTSLLQAQIALCDFQAARYLVDGVVPEQSGNDHPYSTPMGVIATADGFINLAVGGDGQWRDLCRAIQRSDLAEHPDYATQPQRLAHRAQVWALLTPIFAADTSANWLQRLEEVGVPAGPIYRMDEVFEDPQVKHLGLARSVTHPRLGEVTLVGQPIGLSRTPPAVVAPLSDKGADGEAILAEIGLDAGRIAALRAEGIL
ncbi:crotonobetainyl-CoA:carnitine CoA-transferase CaiB-like acyl-CoA transferase [Azorhizobium sp. AG788]|uniref:CaiB/BaiF CoA transferase family protein n=1 Tax=Azorhizobium sp. AG788 TaxID=2183897 RepID=UPI001061F5BB|nr:CaiB/BaiF CoA-transferase family protein [Azorhizobium sp. AG788]TDT99663.1 crotonobetainyl-CoA:carnitine CoA-transferase CaiB-like acyl-CoA transferase [Azorhizobium sp. AG788]